MSNAEIEMKLEAEDIRRGLEDWYAKRHDDDQAEYEAWLERVSKRESVQC